MSAARTKLVCTIGPASVGRIAALIDAGLDVARVNFSHGSDEDRARAFESVRRAEAEAGRAVGILADLSGPKIRLGRLPDGEMTLEAGGRLVLLAGDDRPPDGDGHRATTTYDRLAADVRTGDRVLLADGAAELRVERTDEATGEVVAEVVRGGTLRSGAGVNVPSERLSIEALTDKDREDLPRALELGADFVAQSFVRRARDVEELRGLIPRDAAVKVVAKIETRAAIDDLDAMLRVVDALMVARGDLGVEIPFEEVPIVQKDIVERANRAGVAVVVATQMLESMVAAPRPTRAEASDVANAVLDGADAVLLSAETAIGAFPIEAARAASRIGAAVERLEAERGRVAGRRRGEEQPPDRSDVAAVAYAAAALSGRDAAATAICCFTRSGYTAQLLSSLRPPVPVVAFTPNERVARALTIRHAVVPLLLEPPDDPADLVRVMTRALDAADVLPDGATVVFVASTGDPGSPPNLVELRQLGA